MELLNFVIQMSFGYICIITGIAALCSIHEDWWYPNRLRRKSIDEIGVSTLAYRLFVTIMLIALELLICIASLLRLSFAHTDAIAQDQDLVVTVVEAIFFLWIALCVATLALAIPVSIDMGIVTKHLLTPASSAAQLEVGTSRENQSEVDDEGLPLLQHRNYPYRINDDPNLTRFGSSYGTLVPSSLEPHHSQSVSATLGNASFNSVTSFQAPRRWSPTAASNGPSPSPEDGLGHDAVLQCDFFDADDERDDESEDGDVAGAASPPGHPVIVARTV